MRKYIVEVPYRGVETHLVTAKSKADAMRQVEEGTEPTMIDYRTTRRFSPSGAWLDQPGHLHSEYPADIGIANNGEVRS